MRRQRAVDEGTVDDQVYVVEAVAQDGDASGDGDRGNHEQSRQGDDCLGQSAGGLPNTIIQTSDRAAAEANHLICWRSSPLDRLKRTNSEITAPSPATSIIGTAMKSTNTSIHGSMGRAAHARPSAGPSQARALSRTTRQPRPMEKPPSQATGRQRCEGGCPSGNSRGRNTRIRPSPGAQIHCPSQDASAPKGREPGSVRRA